MTRQPLPRVHISWVAVVTTAVALAAISTATAWGECLDAPTSPIVSIPIELHPGGHWTAQVCVEGDGPYTFILDTAAGANAIYPRLVDAADLKAIPGGLGQVNGASGTTMVRMFRLDSLSMGGIEQVNVVVPLLRSTEADDFEPAVHGILGAPFLRRFRVEIDFVERMLTLSPPDSDRLPEQALDFETAAGSFIQLSVLLNGEPVAAVLDTGARRTAMNWAAARLAGVTEESHGFLPSEDVRGATPHATASVKYQFDSLQGVGSQWADPILDISDLPVFESLGMNDGAAMIMGLDLFEGHRLCIDYARTQVMLERLEPALSTPSSRP